MTNNKLIINKNINDNDIERIIIFRKNKTWEELTNINVIYEEYNIKLLNNIKIEEQLFRFRRELAIGIKYNRINIDLSNSYINDDIMEQYIAIMNEYNELQSKIDLFDISNNQITNNGIEKIYNCLGKYKKITYNTV